MTRTTLRVLILTGAGVLSTPAIAGVPYPKIFVHGLSGSCADWEPMISHVADGRPDEGCISEVDDLLASRGEVDPDSLWNYDYYASGSTGIEGYAERLEVVVQNVLEVTGAEKVVLVGHSMGGLVVRRYMANSNENWESVHRFVTAGTPNLGVYGLLGLGGDCLIWEECNDLDDSSDFIENLYIDWMTMRLHYDGDGEFAQNRMWAILGGAYPRGNKPTNDPTQVDGLSGIPGLSSFGLVEIWSAIPGEWLTATNADLDGPRYMTPNYGFRMAYTADHAGLIETPDEWPDLVYSAVDAIEWADSHDYSDVANTPGYTAYLHPDYNREFYLHEDHLRCAYPWTFEGSQSRFDVMVDTWGDFCDDNTMWNDAFSSITIDAPGYDVVLWTDNNYTGSSYTVSEGVPNFTTLGMDNIVSSFSVVPVDDDGDGVSYYDESVFGTSDQDTDSDDDGVSDGVELELGTDPSEADSDSDGIPDGQEVEAGSDPLDATEIGCAPTALGDWLIEAECVLEHQHAAPEGVRIEAGGLLRVAAGVTLGVDLQSYSLEIGSGGGLLIEEGARLDSECHPGGTSSQISTEVCGDLVDNDCNGQADEEEAEGCTTYYVDVDGDGYGTSEISGRCLCEPEGEYTADNQDDCYDRNSEAHPGATSYHSTARGDGSFDYDCSGSESLQWTDTWDCGSPWYNPLACEWHREGWEDSVPGCGGTHIYKGETGCWAAAYICSPNEEVERTQSCR